MKDLKQFIKTIIIEHLNEGLDGTSWTGHNEETVTLRQILDLTKDIKVQYIETEKLKKIVLSWDGNTEEIEKIEKFWELQPGNELLSNREENEAYLASKSGEMYVLFFTHGGEVGLDLNDVNIAFKVKWLNIRKGVVELETKIKG